MPVHSMEGLSCEAIHEAKSTIHVMDIRNIFDFSDKLIEDRGWRTR